MKNIVYMQRTSSGEEKWIVKRPIIRTILNRDDLSEVE